MSDAPDSPDRNIDSQLLLYIPDWARRLSLIALALLLVLTAASCAFVLRGTDSNADLLIFVLSIMQTSAAGLIFMLILFYSRRDANIETLTARTLPDDRVLRTNCAAQWIRPLHHVHARPTVGTPAS
jgi:hypothetical protein